MSSKEHFDAKQSVFASMPDAMAASPMMPIDKFLQEAENTFSWCQKDKEKLVAAGLDWALIDDIPVRSGALRQAESNWFTARFSREEAQRNWTLRSQEGYSFRADLLHIMEFAYRKFPDILARVQAIADGSGHADMIQDLNDISVLGTLNSDPLKAISFDMTLLDKASTLSTDLAALLASASTNKEDNGASKIVRDKAYSHLKEAIDEVRSFGQFVFWKDEERVRGYASAYNRGRNKTKTVPTSSSKEPIVA